MVDYYNLNKKDLINMQQFEYGNSNEASVHPIFINGEKKVVKVFNRDTDLENKIAKMKLLNERLSDFRYVVTAEYFATYKNKIVGYIMPYISGATFTINKNIKRKDILSVLKQTSEILKKCHELGIVCADFQRNIIVNNRNKIYLIDHDNFAIDDLKVDLKNIYLKEYEKHIKKIDENFDYYLMNLFTIACLNYTYTISLYDEYYYNNNIFDFNDDEINNIVNNTMNLKDKYNEEFIIDKIIEKEKKIRYR